jgi:hypothetical protein
VYRTASASTITMPKGSSQRDGHQQGTRVGEQLLSLSSADFTGVAHPLAIQVRFDFLLKVRLLPGLNWTGEN